MGSVIQIRRGTSMEWAAAVNPLAAGEPGIATDTKIMKIGDGVTLWAALPTVTWNPDIAALVMQATTEPAPAEPGSMLMYTKTTAGRMLPYIMGPAGLSTALQPMLGRNKIGMFTPPGNATTATVLGAYTTPTAIGTAVGRNITTTNLFTRMRRLGYTSAATANSISGARVPAAQVTVGGAEQNSGFFKIIRFGISDGALISTARMFVGVASTVTAPAATSDPATLLNCIGVGCRATDTTLHIFHAGSVLQTPIDLGVNFPADTANTDVYELALFAGPNTPDVNWEVSRLNTGHKASGTIISNGGLAAPGSTVLLTYMQSWRNNGGTAGAVGLDIMSDYIETDY